MEQTEIKLSTEEIAELSDLRNAYGEITARIGRLNLDKYAIEDSLADIESNIEQSKVMYKETIKKEQILVQTLNEKYGQGRIDLESGIFTPDTKS